MIDRLAELMTLLRNRGVSAGDVAEQLGTVEKTGGAHSVMIVSPRDASISRAEIRPGGAADTPKSVELTLSESAQLTLDDLRATFGDAMFVPRVRPSQMDRVQFWLDDGTSAYSLALFASHENEHVRSVLIRRDERGRAD